MIKVIDVKEILRLLSRILLLLIGALLVNAVIAWFIGDPYMPFVITAGVAGLLSFVFYLGKRRCKTESRFRLKEAYITVISSWVLFSLIGTLPYLISGAIPSFIDAFFETVSGFTTTGSSILTDIESLPMSVLFWRSFSHWLGGIGIVVLFIVIMPGLKIGGYHLFTLESSLQEKVEPRVKRVGLSILKIYILLTVIETGLLLFGGMNLFESVTHAFGTIATGGFSPKNDSLAGYSPYIQYVVMIFMLLSGTNFIIHYYLLTHNYNKIKKNEELRFYLLVVLLSGLLITVVLFFKLGKPLETSFRDSFFQIVSVITCTGYATADYLQW
ncbi:MAG: potassium transporter TrkG, partial [Bacteroidales bacterium]